MHFRFSVDLSQSTTSRSLDLVARFKTEVKSGATLFTDLNGLQTIKRERLRKLPLQAHFFPITSHAFLQEEGGEKDECMRCYLHTRQPMGVASLKVREGPDG